MMCFRGYKVLMKRCVIVPLASLFALACLALPLGGARAAFEGYNHDISPDRADIAYDDGADVHSTGNTISILGAKDPVWSPDAQHVAFVSGGNVIVRSLGG